MNFENLNLNKALVDSVRKKGYTLPTPIQQQSIPPILGGSDLFGCAQTGTGKTAAFALPLIQLLSTGGKSHQKHGIQALILAPTRELVIQINENFRSYVHGSAITHTCIYGGVSQVSQVVALKRGVDVLVATPGRLLDLIQQRQIRLDTVRYFVLDEADRMLDMGFIHDIRKIIAMLPSRKQTLFFAATVTAEIKKLADTLLHDPVKVAVSPVSSAPKLIDQSVYYVKKENKRLLLKHLFQDPVIENALVFTRTKHGADRVAKDLNRSGIQAESIHGDKSQHAREKSLQGFKKGKIRVLVATDVASRGIDISKLSHVINYEIPEDASSYVHRIGRTGRAGAQGKAISFCSSEEQSYLRSINKLISKEINVIRTHPFS